MPNRRGFTLIEIIVVLIIISILSMIAVPNYITNMEQGAAKAAQNNLITIYGAQKNFYLTNTSVPGTGALPYYCTISTQNTTCANNLTNLNTGLALTITDTNFTYACSDPNSGTDGNNGSTFSCTATNVSNTSFVLTVTNNPIVLPGGGGTVNPGCVDAANPNYCPSASN
jgi:prepilin-type N-terminal cleavage/methylation domain-containing protein